MVEQIFFPLVFSKITIKALKVMRDLIYHLSGRCVCVCWLKPGCVQPCTFPAGQGSSFWNHLHKHSSAITDLLTKQHQPENGNQIKALVVFVAGGKRHFFLQQIYVLGFP